MPATTISTAIANKIMPIKRVMITRIVSLETLPKGEIIFARLPDIEPSEIVDQISDPLVGGHMPLLTFEWDPAYQLEAQSTHGAP